MNRRAQPPKDSTLAASFKPSTAADLTEAGLAHKASQIAQVFKGRLPTRSELQNITEELGVELATSLLQKLLGDSPIHGEFARRLRALDPNDLRDKSADFSKIEVTLIASNFLQNGRPWAGHVEPWRIWAREVGFTTDVIETNARFSISENARVIREHLRLNPHPMRLIVTYGQGASEFRYLLSRMSIEGISGWLNICGGVSGSSLHQYFVKNRFRKWSEQLQMILVKRNPKALVQTASGFAMWRTPFHAPASILVTSVVGLPLRSQLPIGLHSSYARLARREPNDGVVSFFEAIVPNGFIVPVSGMSHFAEEIKIKPVYKRTLMLMGQSILDKRLSPRILTSEATEIDEGMVSGLELEP